MNHLHHTSNLDQLLWFRRMQALRGGCPHLYSRTNDRSGTTTIISTIEAAPVCDHALSVWLVPVVFLQVVRGDSVHNGDSLDIGALRSACDNAHEDTSHAIRFCDDKTCALYDQLYAIRTFACQEWN
jgi:hypothetical protein